MWYEMKWMLYILRHYEGIQSGSGIHTYFDRPCKNWIVFFNKSHCSIACLDGSSLCELLAVSCCHSIHLSFGCYTAYYCFRHDKLTPSQQRRQFSIFIYTHSFLVIPFLLLLSQSKTRRHLFRRKGKQQQQQKYSYLFRITFT